MGAGRRRGGHSRGPLFGDGCAILSPIGFAYVGLLRAAVYPYLIRSLLHERS